MSDLEETHMALLTKCRKLAVSQAFYTFIKKIESPQKMIY